MVAGVVCVCRDRQVFAEFLVQRNDCMQNSFVFVIRKMLDISYYEKYNGM